MPSVLEQLNWSYLATTGTKCKSHFPHSFSFCVPLATRHFTPMSTSGDTLPVEYRGTITYISIQGLSQSVRNTLSYLSIRRRALKLGFSWAFSLFSPAKGPRVAFSLLSQSESKCLVHGDEGHLIVIGQKYFGPHGVRYNGAQFKESISLAFRNSLYGTTCYTDSIVSLSRTPSPEAKMLRIFGMPVNPLDYFEGGKDRFKSDFAADWWHLLIQYQLWFQLIWISQVQAILYSFSFK
jgi:hypothetical protein